MSTIYLEVNVRPAGGKLRDRRVVMDRRVSQGRRAMIRFDKMGGDRRSGYARRSTDNGFREPLDGE